MEYFLIILTALMPYNLLGEGIGNAFLMLAASFYLIHKRKKIRLNRGYFYCLSVLCVFAVISLVFTHDIMQSVEGMAMYFNMLLFYIIFSNADFKSKRITNIFVITITASSAVSMLYQGIIMGQRISGSIGYANTYGLLLIIALYINEFNCTLKYKSVIKILLIVSLIFTGSRNSYFYLSIFFIIDIYHGIKAERRVNGIIDIFTSIVTYSILITRNIGVMMLLPVILYLIFAVSNKIPRRYARGACIILLMSSLLITFFMKNNFYLRVSSITPAAGQFQERLVFFEDSIKHIISHPLGSGIDSFVYNQYRDQSAFYDVRYIHNSILQTVYDLGIGGGIFLLLTFILGTKIIVKCKIGETKFFIPLYITIILHSMLDFDFSYSTIGIIFVALVAFSNGTDENSSDSRYDLFLGIPALILSTYILLSSLTLFYGDYLLDKSNFLGARKCYVIYQRITPANPSILVRVAETYHEEAIQQDVNVLNSGIGYLLTAEKLCPYDPRIIADIAFSYEYLNNAKMAVKYYKRLINTEKFSLDVYKYYYKFLTKQYNLTGDATYEVYLNELEHKYNSALKLLNPKAVYMNDQLPPYLELMRNN